MASPIKARSAPRTDLSVERLRELLTYDPETGLFYRRGIRRGYFVGTIAGYTASLPRDYVSIRIDDKLYGAHRLAWFYMTGKWPQKYIDHINGKPSDNRWGNLREATMSQNIANSKLSNSNTSGFKGVHFIKSRRKWMAYIKIDYVLHNLGLYDTAEGAAEAYRLIAKHKFGKFANPVNRKEK